MSFTRGARELVALVAAATANSHNFGVEGLARKELISDGAAGQVFQLETKGRDGERLWARIAAG